MNDLRKAVEEASEILEKWDMPRLHEFQGNSEAMDALKTTQFKSDRKTYWETKDGRDIRICDMTDTHLFSAYNISRDELLFEEMVFRLFEQRIMSVKK